METPPAIPNPQAIEDAGQLRLLVIGHYVLGGLTALVSFLPFLHVGMGIMVLNGKFPLGPSNAPQGDQTMGWVFIIFGTIFILLGWSLAVMKILAGRWLSARKHRTFCFVVACIECIGMPLGTILGVFTLVVLSRPSVRALFIAGR